MKRKARILIAALLGVLLLSLCVGIYWTHVKEKRTYEAPKETATDIHVVLSTSDFSDIFHEKVIVTSDQPFRVCYANVTEYKEAGEIVEITEESAIEDIYMLTPQKGASLQVLSISRGYGSPKYEGALEIINTLGGLVLVNQVSVETYLRYVVPSEMPASYGAEALKAQAVCARNFAYQHILNPSYPAFDADLDDSIRYQVYNNSEPHTACDQAISDTAGVVLQYGEELVNTYYYSTSWGFTTDATLWGGGALPYYQSRHVGEEDDRPDLTDEEVFRQVMNREGDGDYTDYEETEVWYRWETTVGAGRILENLKEMNYDTSGALTGISVSGRRAGGSVSKLRVQFDSHEIVLTAESEIRKCFWPKEEELKRNDGSVLQGYEKLPSSFFYIDVNQNENQTVASVTIHGGGCGHGLGMTQNGAKKLAEIGFTYADILDYFYPGTACVKERFGV